MRVFVTGATGLIGRRLCAALVARGHAVTALTRQEPARARLAGAEVLRGDPGVPGPWLDALARADACVQLAGEPVAAGRWTPARKAEIERSRVAAAAAVAALVAERGPRVLVQGSAVGYYGSRGDEPLDEAAPPGDDFLARVCVRWEAAAAPAARRARVVLLRTGMVLAPEGGALPELARPFRFLAGGTVGDAGAWKPWIHADDEVGLAVWALEEERVAGPLNACAPEPARAGELARALGAALGRPSLLPAPAAAVRLALGELAGVVLASQRVLPQKALGLGYRFLHPSLGPALRDLLAPSAGRRAAPR
jgi:uncharacterized protein (TIGR01777 family)